MIGPDTRARDFPVHVTRWYRRRKSIASVVYRYLPSIGPRRPWGFLYDEHYPTGDDALGGRAVSEPEAIRNLLKPALGENHVSELAEASIGRM